MQRLMARMPAQYPGSLFLVQHTAPTSPLGLADIFAKTSALPSRYANDSEKISAGQLYIAPPDMHLSFRDGMTALSKGPRENSHRPSVDVLFRSAAEIYGKRVIGIVLSGYLS